MTVEVISRSRDWSILKMRNEGMTLPGKVVHSDTWEEPGVGH